MTTYQNSSQTNLLQSSSWAKVKDEWENERIGFIKIANLLPSASIFNQTFTSWYDNVLHSRGPVMNYQDKDLVNFVLTSLKSLPKEKEPYLLSLILLFCSTTIKLMRKPSITRKHKLLLTLLKHLGCEWLGQTSDMGENYSAAFPSQYLREGFSEANLSKNPTIHPYCQNKGVSIRFGGYELLADFSDLMKNRRSQKHSPQRH